MPGLSLAEATVPYRGLNLSMTGDRLTFEDLAIRFNVTENMENYIEIFNWMHNIIGTGGTENQYKFDATLMIMSSHNNLTKSIRFKDVFPTSLTAVEFNSQSSDVEYLQADVSFRYTAFEFE
jgi:hypothetical protein